MIKRDLEQIISSQLFKRKVIILLGPRQVGKTTLLQMLKEKTDKELLYLNCDDNDIKKLLTDVNIHTLQRIIGKHEVVLIDEAQRVMNIGMTLKLIADQMPHIQLIITGSSSLDLANMVHEPLTGRKFEYMLFPLSMGEIVNHMGYLETKRSLNDFLIFGTYPDVINNKGKEREALNNLTSSYLFKDIFMYQDIRKPGFIEQLLEALALQLASEVSYNELAQLLRTDPHTVQRYISLLEKAFVIFRLRSYSRNARNELKKSRKIYFYDNGIRNAILSNFSPVNTRNDAGLLWENFFIAERLKYLHYHKIFSKRYFWRTTQQQEIDYLEESDGVLHAFDIKLNPGKNVKFPVTFTKNYAGAKCSVVHPENYLDFLIDD